jgi:PAS domain S-box-containing protein
MKTSSLTQGPVARLEAWLYGSRTDSITAERLSRHSRREQSGWAELFAMLFIVLESVGILVWTISSTKESDTPFNLWTSVFLCFLTAIGVGASQILLRGSWRCGYSLMACQLFNVIQVGSQQGGDDALYYGALFGAALLLPFLDFLLSAASVSAFALCAWVTSTVAARPAAGWHDWAVYWGLSAALLASALIARRTIELVHSERAAELDKRTRFEEQLLDKTEELRRSEIRKSAVVENALDCIIALDSKGHISEFNAAAERVFERSREDMRGQSFLKLFPSRNWDQIMRMLQSAASRTEGSGVLGKRMDQIAIRPNGVEFPIELTLTSARLSDEGLLTAFVRDLSEQKSLESQLAHAQKMESIGQMSAGIAHEINTPNQYIADNIEFIRQSFDVMTEVIRAYEAFVAAGQQGGDVSAAWQGLQAARERSNLAMLMSETPDALKQAQEGVERVRTIVRAMKDFAHPGSVQKVQMDINQVIESTATLSRNEWKYSCEMTLKLDPNLPLIPGRPSELGQVILNMIINGVHAIKEKHGSGMGRIEIATKFNDEAVELVITDNGSGIPARVQKKIFDPFFTTKGVGIGTGQGLAISHNVIVAMHGGQIRFVTKEGEGTSFIIKLPRYAADNQNAGRAA